ncbi:metallophosphoesterase [Actinoplanes sp. NBRC 101535]|uniref:metallophosphoesterase n=1 Tax=Actinoplanes sp. NBRC 101535 TaxID=3032196 RepID=UPI0024A2A594|nr:metallophosphoesterase [Actinoplanes sp. NBRC 101535]GLY02097.1 hypothetical protein Acsp01_24760 [Actinoplanes sp. NBRC 101535]
MKRRIILRTGAATAFAALGTAPAARTEPAGVNQRFAVAVLPDTQILFSTGGAGPEPLHATLRYLLDRRVAFLAHLGDITEHGTTTELELAGRAFATVDGKLPYSVLAGNHDVTGDDQRGRTAYLDVFGPHRFRRAIGFLGASPDGYNSAHRFHAGGRAWLVLALDWRISDGGLAWAQGVLAANPTLPAIVTTHDLATADKQGTTTLSDHGRRLWQKLITKNDQIFLTVNGHHVPPGRTVLRNTAGHDVHVHVTNYQDRYQGGAAMIRLYHFDLARGRIDVETFAPWFLTRPAAGRTPLETEHSELTGDADRFTLTIDFEERFAGFTPKPAPR